MGGEEGMIKEGREKMIGRGECCGVQKNP